MNSSRWFYVDGVLTEIRGSEQTIRERVRELELAHSRVHPAQVAKAGNWIGNRDPLLVSGHRRDRRR